MTMKSKDDIREQVRQSYAKAVAAKPSGVCGCGPAKGSVSSFAGYMPEELTALPEDVAASSFGCGNPVAFTHVEPGQTVLDLGSGAGLDLLLAARKVGPTGRVIGVDMTSEMIERARGNVAAAGLSNVEVHQGLIEDLPVESSSVDWVISNCVINLSPEKPKVFKEIARVLRPGGRMLVSDLMAKDLPGWVLAIEEMYSNCVAGAIGEEEYVAGLKAAGLVNVEVMSRVVYDRDQLAGLIKSELPESSACCGPTAAKGLTGLANALAGELAGRVWSANVYAEKPPTGPSGTP